MDAMINAENFPETEEIFSWIEDMASFGHRKTGTPQGLQSAEYLRDKFIAFGLEEVEIEDAKSVCMFVDKCDLTIDGEKIETMFINGTNRRGEEGRFAAGEDGTQRELVYLGKGLEEDFEGADIEGKIVMCDICFRTLPIDRIAAEVGEEMIYDKEGRLKAGEPILDIYTPNTWPDNYFRAQQRGAAGFIGVLQDYVDDPYWYSEDYTFYGEMEGIPYMELPGMLVSKSTAAKIAEKLKTSDAVYAKMEMVSRYEYKDAHNVKGILKGESDEIVLIHSHHDAVFAGGVQDASGMSQILALAKYFGNPANKKSSRTYMFAALDTHFTDYGGHEGFIAKRQENRDRIVYDFAVEHIGREVVIRDGRFVETGEGVAKLLYVSSEPDDPGLVEAALAGLKKYDIDKTIVIPVVHKDGDPDPDDLTHVMTDAYMFEAMKIKVVSMLSSPPYLYHPSDTPERVMKEWLQPVAMMYAEIIESV